MIKIIRVFVGIALGIGIASYLLDSFVVHGVLTYLFGTLIVMATLFVIRGFRF